MVVDLNEVRKAILLDDQIVDVDIHYDNNMLLANCKISRKAADADKAREITTSLKGLLALYKIPKISFKS